MTKKKQNPPTPATPDEIVRRVLEGIEKRGKMPAAERLQDMRDRGVIDNNGKVLLRMPSGPRKTRKAKS